MTGKIGVALALALLCGSCTRGFEIKPSGVGTAIKLTFYEGGLLWDSPTNPCITKLTVSEERWPTRQPSRAVWQISASNGCVRLAGVEIGKVPAGFVEDVGLLPLRLGRMYGAYAMAERFMGGSMPWFACSDAPAIIDWKNDYRLEDPPARCSR